MTTVSLTPYADKAVAPDVVADAVMLLDAEYVPDSDFAVVVSERAAAMVKSALLETENEDGEFLRVGIRGGGCAGFQYSLTFTDEVDDDDFVTAAHGVKVVCDTFSACYLKGTELDYVESLQGSGFKFINPNARRTCGCGSSFAA